MKPRICHGIFALAVLGGAAVAQPGSTPPELQEGIIGRGDIKGDELRLTEAQKSTIVASVRKANKPIAAPTKFEVSVGASVPPAMELHLLPDDVLVQVPGAKNVKYTIVDNQLVLVDPTTMRIVEVIPR
jgi:hypothetical protein